MRLLEFGRSTILFRIDLDVLPPKTLSHKPPFAMNNARIQIDSVCRVTERDTGRVHTFVLGGDCKTERVGATADLFLEPNADGTVKVRFYGRCDDTLRRDGSVWRFTARSITFQGGVH